MDSINGVTSVTSGYAGGTKEAPAYRQAGTGNTGGAEVVQIEFDASVIRFADLLRIFMMMHNPTAANTQEANKYSRYRSVILYNSVAQEQTARQIIGELQADFDNPIVTEVAPLDVFYKAEAHHQRYYKSDPSKAFCRLVISPKLSRLRNRFSNYLKPVVLL